jgi:membrane-associated phospholipid phosphatase
MEIRAGSRLVEGLWQRAMLAMDAHWHTVGTPMDAPHSFQTPAEWLNDAWSRMRTLLWVKLVGITLFMTVFFTVYFWLLNHPRYPVTTVPRIFIDRMIPFQPGALALYLSLWVYVTIAPALLRLPRECASYAVAAVVLGAVGFGIFIVWPTAVPMADVDPLLLPSLSHLKAVDASGNAFPSLHVAFAVFTALWFGRLLKEMRTSFPMRAFNWIWCAGIVYSTIAIRQHVALDAIAGAALGALVALLQQRILDARRADGVRRAPS